MSIPGKLTFRLASLVYCKEHEINITKEEVPVYCDKEMEMQEPKPLPSSD